jgi:hypothetical protein
VLNNYLNLLNDLVALRQKHNGLESAEEDNLLGKMDSLWFTLTDEERVLVQELPSRSIIEPSVQKKEKDL